MVTIKIIIGSTRPSRFGTQPAEWLMGLSKQYGDRATFEMVDLAEINLPMLDESLPASYDQYANEHTKAWAKIVDDADGFIMVSSEYNHSYAPSLKNALDFLYKEWTNKPVSFVSYGADAGGTRGVEHLRGVVGWLKMYDLSENLILPHYYTNVDEKGNFKFAEEHEKKAHSIIEQQIFWAEQMKTARQTLAEQQ
jgi:NAD(P)H-dependent FMN reductase